MDKYVHKDGLLISCAESYSLLQSATTNSNKYANRVLMGSAGALTGAYTVEELSAPTEASSDRLIRVTVGPVMFPNGEVFLGERFRATIPVSANLSPQYLIMRYQPLRQTPGKYVSSIQPTAEYYYRINGLRMYLTTALFTVNMTNELPIAKLTYAPGDSYITIEDMLPYFSTFMPGHCRLNIEEINDIFAGSGGIEAEQSIYTNTFKMDFVYGVNKIGPVYSTDSAAFIRWEITPDAYGIALINGDMRAVAADGNVLSYNRIVNLQYDPFSEFTKGYLLTEHPVGLNISNKVRYADSACWDKRTDFTEPTEQHVGYKERDDGSFEFDVSAVPSFPAATIRVRETEAANADGLAYAQLWASDVPINVDVDKPKWEVPLVYSTAWLGSAARHIFPASGASKIHVMAREILPGNRLGGVSRESVDYGIDDSSVGRYPIVLNFGGDNYDTAPDSEHAQRWFFSNFRLHEYPICKVRAPNNSRSRSGQDDPVGYLRKAELYNFAESTDPLDPPHGDLYFNGLRILDVYTNDVPGAPQYYTSWTAADTSEYILLGSEAADVGVLTICADNAYTGGEDYMAFCGMVILHVVYLKEEL